MTQYEDNATKALQSILNSSVKKKKELIFNFLICGDVIDKPKQKENSLKKIKKCRFDKFFKAESRITLRENTRPDLTLFFLDGTKINVEVKVNNDNLTQSEKEDVTRDIYLVRKH